VDVGDLAVLVRGRPGIGAGRGRRPVPAHWAYGPGVGVSAGAASVTLRPRMTVTPGALFSAADRAQYVAKRGRLSTTVLTQELGPEPDG
jgi:hypothetical protein